MVGAARDHFERGQKDFEYERTASKSKMKIISRFLEPTPKNFKSKYKLKQIINQILISGATSLNQFQIYRETTFR